MKTSISTSFLPGAADLLALPLQTSALFPLSEGRTPCFPSRFMQNFPHTLASPSGCAAPSLMIDSSADNSAKISPSVLASGAVWIWAPQTDGANAYAEFRCTFDLPSVPDEASLQISAETSLRVWVNGVAIHQGPPREVPPHFYFDTLDLRPHLHPGANEICLLAHHQGQDSASRQAGAAAVLVAGGVVIAGAGVIDFNHLANWQARRAERYRPEAPRLFSCLGFSERVDFTQAESPWGAAVEIARHPWIERPQALPRDLPFFPQTRRGAVLIEPNANGFRLDFGQEVSGYVHLQLRAKSRGEIHVAYAEALTDGIVDWQKQGLSYRDTLILPEGETTWRSYEKRAFRYAQITGAEEIIEAAVFEEGYPYEHRYRDTGSYRANALTEEGRLINRILEVSARTIELNSEDLLTDCPWRERAQYFDCYFYMEAMHRLFGTLAPIRRFLHQFPRGADASGLLRMCYPSPPGTSIIPDFSMTYSVHLRRYLELTGDLETVQGNLRFAERGITAFQTCEDANGLLTDVPGWIFLDNTFELPKFPRSAALNAVYYGGQRALADLQRTGGEVEKANVTDRRADRLRRAWRQTFLREDRVLDCDATPEHEANWQWIYHYPGDSGVWTGGAFCLRVSYRFAHATQTLRLAVHDGARAWIDGKLVAEIKHGGSWTRSALFQPVTLEAPADTERHVLDLEVQWSGIDWECYLSSSGELTLSEAIVCDRPTFGEGLPFDPPKSQSGKFVLEPVAGGRLTRLRRQQMPWMSQITVGYSAFHGLLEEEEARRFLTACLPESYPFPFAKRNTPFFAEITDQPVAARILPCNVPASLFYFCHALRKYGLGCEAKKLLLPIYTGMLERGATTWWEEWNTRSSLCHAWASFVVEFMEEAP